MQVVECTTRSLPQLLAQMPCLAELALEDCQQLNDLGALMSVDGAALLPALAPLQRLTSLSLAGTDLANLYALPPLPGACAGCAWLCACKCAVAAAVPVQAA